MRQVRYKEVLCLWRVLGHDVAVKAVVAEVEGYKKRFTLVSSAIEPERACRWWSCSAPGSGRRTPSGT